MPLKEAEQESLLLGGHVTHLPFLHTLELSVWTEPEQTLTASATS